MAPFVVVTEAYRWSLSACCQWCCNSSPRRREGPPATTDGWCRSASCRFLVAIPSSPIARAGVPRPLESQKAGGGSRWGRSRWHTPVSFPCSCTSPAIAREFLAPKSLVPDESQEPFRSCSCQTCFLEAPLYFIFPQPHCRCLYRHCCHC